ncbi:glycosyltransferase [Flavihumibacter rivuli]|uniref:glycosyltransferase n=1 Tax=Flavihumibacter rivuli TaxID=2838156 RepID=UPI001BDDE93F|nr:glycosyltransferase [Flavihumibacter rivuli]ULQ56253.1 glycosyltransferase [Flavihumibacter rivuli]
MSNSLEQPLVSIVLPVKDHLRFIDARLDSILYQDYANWTCHVIDGCSTDGTWQRIVERVGKDPRFQLEQREPRGIYDAWNYGIRSAKGQYLYIATSDDTMEPNGISSFVAHLEQYPACGMAHCNLRIIDEHGQNVEPNPWDKYLPQQFYGSKMKELHIRKAPVDGLLHSVLFTIYTSVTQLFFRRSVFDEVGLFSLQFGAKADFEWGMRASLIVDVLHVPEYLATWRTHQEQVTAKESRSKSSVYKELALMVESASVSGIFSSKYLSRYYRSRIVEIGCIERPKRFQRLIFIMMQFFKDPLAVIEYFKCKGVNPLQVASIKLAESGFNNKP